MYLWNICIGCTFSSLLRISSPPCAAAAAVRQEDSSWENVGELKVGLQGGRGGEGVKSISNTPIPDEMLYLMK